MEKGDDMENNENITVTRNYCGIKDEVAKLINQLRAILYPNIFGTPGVKGFSEEVLEMNANETLKGVLSYFIEEEEKQTEIVKELIESLPEIQQRLNTDIVAAYRGDAAAQSYDEIMLSYPSFEVLSVFRIANKLYQMNVPILPRMMTEYAHSITGIDIHPGATIGDYFFIDHGTGVVIGETANIGNHVKIYQGVTVGAKSFETDEDGNIIKGNKRHPNIGDNVVIYANSTILGGDTTIGDNCVIGASVWLTKSVEPNTIVMAANNEVKKRNIN